MGIAVASEPFIKSRSALVDGHCLYRCIKLLVYFNMALISPSDLREKVEIRACMM